MATETVSTPGAGPQTFWLPLIVVALAQMLMSFNINALRVSDGGIVASFNTFRRRWGRVSSSTR
jgi:hypothetical protein